MIAEFHRLMTLDALQDRISQAALNIIINANLHQDSMEGVIAHPEFHFDNSEFIKSQEYLHKQKALLFEALENGEPVLAWQAFGRITHAVQDFYSHSNYVRLWVQNHPDRGNEDIDPLDADIINHPDLRSGRVYSPWEGLAYLPFIGKSLKHLLPRDSHAWMNLDSPESGPLFRFARSAATKRTRVEFEVLISQLTDNKNQKAANLFCDLSGPPL
jgi:hypothetical protein